MKESKLYLSFFKENLLLIVSPTLVLLLFSLYKAYYLPQIHIYHSLYEIKSGDVNFNRKIAEADQAVTLLRSENIKKSLNISEDVKVQAFRPAPLLIKLELRSAQMTILGDENLKYEPFLFNRYKAGKIGESYYSQELKPFLIYAVFGAGVGFLLGFFISLLKTYFRKF